MAKDEAIRNQKVFVRLDGVLAVQAEYKRLSVNYKRKTTEAQQADWKDEKKQEAQEAKRHLQGFERVIRLLQLPIEIGV
jgi:hypothetical protein